MKKTCLQYLLSPWIKYAPKKNILTLNMDSRQSIKGELFIAVPGVKQDGRNFIYQVIKKQVSAILYNTDNKIEHGIYKYINQIPIIKFFDLSKNISKLASRFYDQPEKKLTIIGVTGTNGKTTVTQLINQWSYLLGNKTATMGTLGNGFHNSLYPTKNTTSSAIIIHSFLSIALKKKAKLVTMEVSSHSLTQNRVISIPFYIAIFTNLTPEHLDYHDNMEKYESAKWLLFSTHQVQKIILNADDPYGKKWLKKLFNFYTVAVTINDSSQKKYATKWLNATQITLIDNYVHITFESSWGNAEISSCLIGDFNVTNLLLSLAALLELGHNLSDIINLSKKIKPISGRMQIFTKKNKPIFIIDYAHTPDALKKTLNAIRLHYKKYIWCIFGCGGEKDKTKRSIMGNIAENISNQVIITNDNPRHEKETVIIQDILSGCQKKEKIIIIRNRKKAISYAYFKAKYNHIIFIAGKGHETTQIIRNKSIIYSDQKTVLNLLEKNI
ncbi:UDP-N-acetylmuramoyl-L-alanyl-D-glutamate--2,6-diaminopimelate ligase [Buchnera aphidicola (Uroleucon sonchi)]|uniref:UDP-N-acetylmuramoyl-L-alanyl-D-glutamate--2,6-diaminopimelate ligase n=1 Tax=Buchnera aphidicola subsp. Uroleucon sonchi TaxID=118118 RepID=A0A6C1FIS9_BUCUN|nr:UDP-N-acetylmuramoyl-L-alanyl-D-glutamate--2,6-diaminopimelate ligase [Buchnera aphidicola (Uroleucon sonchi)]